MSPPKMSASASVRSIVSPPRRRAATSDGARRSIAPRTISRRCGSWESAARGASAVAGWSRPTRRNRSASISYSKPRIVAVVRLLEAIRLRCRAPSAGRTPPRPARRSSATSVDGDVVRAQQRREASRRRDARRTRPSSSAASTMSRPAACDVAAGPRARSAVAGGRPGRLRSESQHNRARHGGATGDDRTDTASDGRAAANGSAATVPALEDGRSMKFRPHVCSDGA